MENSDIKLALDRLRDNHLRYQTYYDYYEGKHQLAFSSKKFKEKFGERFQHLRQNLCRAVVKAPVSRLEANGFQSDAKDIQEISWNLWKNSKMPRHAVAVHREAFKTGDAYVIVWKNSLDQVVISPQLAQNITVWRNVDTDEIEKAAKGWFGSDEKYYLTLYYPDKIEKFVSAKTTKTIPQSASDFIERQINGEDFPLSNPFSKVPVFQFKYDADLSDFGTSILKDVIPLNDALNISWSGILVSQEENTRRRRHIAGMTVEKDEETGKKINPFKPDDDIFFADDKDTKFGEFSDVELTQMLQVLENTIKAIAMVSGIPPSYFNLEQIGSAVSGEALRKIEARFTAIVQEAQRAFGETWAEVISFGLQISNQSNSLKNIEVQWTDAAPIGENELLDNALKKKALGWSVEQIQRDFGLSDEQIKKMMEENTKREQEKLEQQTKMFDQGDSFIND